MSNDDWAIDPSMLPSTEVRYFDPRDPTHPLKYLGAQNYRGQICDCEQGNPDNCGFHYPNGHPNPPPCPNCEHYGFPCKICAEESECINCDDTNGKCEVCDNDTDFPCLQCSAKVDTK
jgi:hypothetical protein